MMHTNYQNTVHTKMMTIVSNNSLTKLFIEFKHDLMIYVPLRGTYTHFCQSKISSSGCGYNNVKIVSKRFLPPSTMYDDEEDVSL